MTYETYFSGRPKIVGPLPLSEVAPVAVTGELIVGNSAVRGVRIGVSRGLERADWGLELGVSSSRETEEAILVRAAGYGLWNISGGVGANVPRVLRGSVEWVVMDNQESRTREGGVVVGGRKDSWPAMPDS